MFLLKVQTVNRITARTFTKRNLTQAASAAYMIDQEPKQGLEKEMDPKDMDKMMTNLIKFNELMSASQYT